MAGSYWYQSEAFTDFPPLPASSERIPPELVWLDLPPKIPSTWL